ncbi:MAG: pilus assembly protein [Hyphomicrobiales bacterium]|nr:pilus assembly protein [Hyphomicrobiales bacterium]
MSAFWSSAISFCKQSLKKVSPRRFGADEKGATAVEFGIVAFPFFFLLSAIIEASLFFFAGQMLESAVDRVGRQIRTGQMDSSTTQAELKTAVCDEASLLFDCSTLLVDLKSAATFSDLGDPPEIHGGELDASYFGFSSPGSAKIMRITVTYEWPVFSNYVASHLANLNSGNALLTAISVFRTEAY